MKTLNRMPFASSSRAVVILMLFLANAWLSEAQAQLQLVKGKFVAHVIKRQSDSGPPLVVTEPNATVQLPIVNSQFDPVQLTSATLELTAPAETPRCSYHPTIPVLEFYHTGGHQYLTIGATISSTLQVPTPVPPRQGVTAGTKFYLRGSIVAGWISGQAGSSPQQIPRQEKAAVNGATETLTSSALAQIGGGSAEVPEASLGFSERTRGVVSTGLDTGTSSGTFATWGWSVTTYYEMEEVDQFSPSIAWPPSPQPGTPLEEGLSPELAVDVSYKLVTRPQAEIGLTAVNARGEIVGFANPKTIFQGDPPSSKVTLRIPPFVLHAEMGSLMLKASLFSGADVLQQVVLDSPYPVVRNELLIRKRAPSEDTLKSGTTMAFSVDLDHWLRTRNTATLGLEVLRASGEVVASSPLLTISRSETPQQATLTAASLIILNEFKTLALRIRMKTGQTILREALQTGAYLIDPGQAALRVVKVVEDAEVKCLGGDWELATVGMYLAAGCQISTGPDAELHLLFPDDSVMIVKQMTEVLVNTLLKQNNAFKAQVLLKIGEVSAQVNPLKVISSDFSVATPVATASVRGTVLNMRHVGGPEPMSTLDVTEGNVDFAGKGRVGMVNVAAGSRASITAKSITSPGGPTIGNLNPTTGTSGTTQVTITGSNFSVVTADNVVRFGGVAAPVLSASSTQLTATVPVGLPSGPVPVEVTTSGFTSNAVNFEVVAAQSPTAVSGSVAGTWTRALSPYLVNGVAAIPAGQRLDLEPGVVVMFATSNSSLQVEGTLAAPGTVAAPIRFTSSGGTSAGQWGGIRFGDTNNDANTRLSHCIVEYGGAAPFPAALEFINASPRIESCSVHSSLGHGMHLSGSDPRVEGCLVVGNAGSAFWLENTSFPVLDENLAITNGRDAISVAAQTVSRSGTWFFDDAPYLLRGDVQIAAGQTLTIASGTEVQAIDPETDLTIQGALVARGTLDRRITFTSDEAAPNKAPGQWGALIFSAGSVGSVLEHGVVEYAGGGARNGGAELLGSSPAIAHSLFQTSARDGLFASGSSTQIEDSRFLGNGRDGIRLEPAGGLSLHNSVIAGNTALGLNNLSTQAVSAQSNFWGHASGPLDNSNADGAGLLNPTGLGSPVSEYVNWGNFLAEDPFEFRPPLPELDFKITREGGEVVLSWLDGVATNVVLQQSGGAGGLVNWQPSTLPTTLNGTRRHAVVPVTPGASFFRLEFSGQ